MILVTGGAGYIGSHTVSQLLACGEKVVVLDDLRTGHRWAVPSNVAFEEGDLGDTSFVEKVFSKYSIDSVIHFAASLDVEESMRLPDLYYRNNVASGLNFLNVVRRHPVKSFIYSSTCSVYGTPEHNPVTEKTPTLPVSTYAKSKLAFEWMLRDMEAAGLLKLKSVVLRYFNVAGASPSGELGQLYRRPTQLVSACASVAAGLNSELKVFGTDYSTKDGTCIRDYIHVDDLAKQHVLALGYLRSGGNSETFNCGSGSGYSVREVVNTFKKVNGIDFKVIEHPRRPGDAVAVYADVTKIRSLLKAEPQYTLADICRTAWRWEKEGKAKKMALQNG